MLLNQVRIQPPTSGGEKSDPLCCKHDPGIAPLELCGQGRSWQPCRAHSPTHLKDTQKIALLHCSFSISMALKGRACPVHSPDKQEES